MDETPVVTVFLRNGTAVLLLRRSEEVGSYRGQWGGVAGHAEGDPDAAARAEVEEETGIDPDTLALVRRGDPVEVPDADLDTRWVVHPYLFDCPTRAVETDWETTETAWVVPPEILRRETVPKLWEAYAAVSPTPERVAADETHGSAYISVRAVEALRDRAALLVERPLDGREEAATGAPETGWDALAELAADLLDARPSMAALRNRVNRVMHDARESTPAAVEGAATVVIDDALAADAGAAAEAVPLLANARVFTLSRSGTVTDALREGDPDVVVVAESRPAREGVVVAERLAADGLDVTLVTDAAACWLAGEADLALVGADTVLPDGRLVNKVGTRALALAAARVGVAVYAVCAADKVSPDGHLVLEEGDPAAVYDGAAPLTVRNPTFDVTPADLLAGVVTEEGVLDADEVAAVAERHRALGAWRR